MDAVKKGAAATGLVAAGSGVAALGVNQGAAILILATIPGGVVPALALIGGITIVGSLTIAGGMFAGAYKIITD